VRSLVDTNILIRNVVRSDAQNALVNAMHDVRLVALMLAHGVTHLLTLNGADFRRYSEITCLRPDAV
jgi:hypothetical protein